jgi:hypothetical protein
VVGVTRLFHQEIRDDRPGEASVFRLSDERLQPVPVDDGVADHRRQRASDLAAHFAHSLQNVADLDLVRQRSRVGRLDDRAVGDRIAVRDSDLAQAGAALGQLLDHRRSERQIRIAGGDKGDEGFAIFAAKLLK